MRTICWFVSMFLVFCVLAVACSGDPEVGGNNHEPGVDVGDGQDVESLNDTRVNAGVDTSVDDESDAFQPPNSGLCSANEVDVHGDGTLCASTQKVVFGIQRACAITESGELYCWGKRFSQEATPLAAIQIGTDGGWQDIAIGLGHVCGIRMGRLYCWGTNSDGELGTGTVHHQESPTRVGTSSAWQAVATTLLHTCGINAGELFCWGSNQYGQLGNGAKSDEAVTGQIPQRVGDQSGWTMVSTSGQSTCGMREHAIYCFGLNSYGQLGTGSRDDAYLPTKVGQFEDWTHLDVQHLHGCAIRQGKVYCWGNNEAFESGSSGGFSLEPRLIDDSALEGEPVWSDVRVGGKHSCGLAGGALYCWGSNEGGERGNPELDYPEISKPTQIGQNADWHTIGAGSRATCAFRAQTVYCWGEYMVGLMGEGNDIYAPTPVTGF